MKPLPTVIVLAAGRGERFFRQGGRVHKLQATLAGSTVIARCLQAVAQSGLPCHVVHAAAHLRSMGDSIAQGVADCEAAPGWLLLPADLPLVLPSTLRAVADAIMEDGFEAARPSYRGKSGHPVGFSAFKRAELLNLKGFGGGVSVFAQSVASIFEVNDSGVLLDIDTPERLRQARDLLRSRSLQPQPACAILPAPQIFGENHA